jgi:hypothetical protein
LLKDAFIDMLVGLFFKRVLFTKDHSKHRINQRPELIDRVLLPDVDLVNKWLQNTRNGLH